MEECMEGYLRSETRAHNCRNCKVHQVTKYWLQRDTRIAAADIHAPRGPKGTRGSIRHQAHITEHTGLIHIDKEMVHSIEREREGQCAVASNLYMLGGKYFFIYIYQLYSLTISALTCYHKGAALLRHSWRAAQFSPQNFRPVNHGWLLAGYISILPDCATIACAFLIMSLPAQIFLPPRPHQRLVGTCWLRDSIATSPETPHP